MKQVLFLLAAMSLIFSGCDNSNVMISAEPVSQPAAVPEFAGSAVDAVGGVEAWRHTQAIIGEATAKFYRPDGTFYLTTQRHTIYPWSDSIKIQAQEPQGIFIWQLTGDNFCLAQDSCRNVSDLPMTLSDEYIARGIITLMAAPAAVAKKAGFNSRFGEAARVEGLWHYPLSLEKGQILYMNRDTNFLDIYTMLTDCGILRSRGYDYRMIEKTGIWVPSKIEIFTAEPSTASLRRVIEFDYVTLASN